PTKPPQVSTGDDRSIAGSAVKTADDPADPVDRSVMTGPDGGKPMWPAAADVTVDLPAAAAASRSGAAVRATSGLSVAVPSSSDVAKARVTTSAAPAKVRVRSFDHAMSDTVGVTGQVFRLSRADGAHGFGPVSVSVDYSGYAN